MKPKIYTTSRERKIDQLIGFVACPLLNVPLLAANWLMPLAGGALHVPTQAAQVFQVCVSLLPWIVNGLVLVLAFLFRHHIAIGYVAAIGVTVCASGVLGALFLPACFIACMVGAASSNGHLALLVFSVLMLAGVLLLGLAAVPFIIWWGRYK
jgi:hypothetical protein